MHKHSWKYIIQDIIKSMAEMNIGAGGIVDFSPPPNVYVFAPAFWLDFLHAYPEDSRSVWPTYREFAIYIQEFKDWLTKEGYYCKEVKEMRLLPKEEFLERYATELQADAERLHRGMKEVIDKDKSDVIKDLLEYTGREESEDIMTWIMKREQRRSRTKEILAGGADIPQLSFTVRVVNAHNQGMKVKMIDRYQFLIPAANHPNFWLSVILAGMVVSSCKDGRIIVQRCAAPDCQKYFVPTSRGRTQKYHSPACRSRYNMRKRRKALL